MLKLATKEKNSRWSNLFVVKKLKLYDGWSQDKGPFFQEKAKMIKKKESTATPVLNLLMRCSLKGLLKDSRSYESNKGEIPYNVYIR